ncbi:PREDICTED: uncharacterized protein LOC100632882 [Amphimedon queenslandica]|uniref:Uncharacterized protein n=1 Tax=Amphimedon queenslandica TaxID=400682 RepID=A0A1X7UHM5_AMPQE|nr:PREDICTED: uncharacterized protein LOC100632882 [Amphimedon queenslandica]|eukprot:XP_003387786.1 PREDICTED: uncharacterized protein LOC100632882 [Amphimedon queenslandica]
MQKVVLFFLAAVFIGTNATIDESQCYEPPSGNLYSLYRNCRKATDSRSTRCMNVVDRYCSDVTYAFFGKLPTATSGIMRGVKANTNEIFISCITTQSKNEVKLSDLTGCNSFDDIQSKECLKATREYCQRMLGSRSAGYIYLTSASRAHTVCFNSVEQGTVSPSDMSSLNSNCNDLSDAASSDCFNAACKWCEGKGHDGGITQGIEGSSMIVACYKDNFHKYVQVKSALSQSSYYYRQYLAAKRRYEQARQYELANEEEYGENEGPYQFRSDIREE